MKCPILLFALSLVLVASCGKKEESAVAQDEKCRQFAVRGLNLYSSMGNDSILKPHDFTYPDHRSEYKPGTLVKAKDGRVYRCKDFPYTYFCGQWSAGTSIFEPGIGSNWMAAWDLQ